MTDAVRAPGATVTDPDGSAGRRATGRLLPGPSSRCASAASTSASSRWRRAPRASPTPRATTGCSAALVPQVAVVVRALELAEALEAERDRVVAATRTERDRLRRDLHDGLGPSLSGIRLGLLALHDAVTAGRHATGADMLDRIRLEVDTTVGEVRRIIDGLRPAVLDDTGLAGALRRHAAGASAARPRRRRLCPSCRSCRRRSRPRPTASRRRP